MKKKKRDTVNFIADIVLMLLFTAQAVFSFIRMGRGYVPSAERTTLVVFIVMGICGGLFCGFLSAMNLQIRDKDDESK